MTYKLGFHSSAKKEWDALDSAIQLQFKKKLKKRLEEPRVESDRLSGLKDCYKIKLRSIGYRMVYQVNDNTIIVSIVAVGKCERNKAYKAAVKRI